MPESELSDPFYHPSIVKWLKDGGDFTVEGKSVVGGVGEPAYRNGRKVFEKHFFLEYSRWVKVAVSVQSNNPVADVFATMGYGHTGASTSLFNRRSTKLRVESFDVELEPNTGSVLHGQGSSSVHFLFDFRNPAKPIVTTSPNETKNVPHDGNQTGGKWDYMQVRTPLDTGDLLRWRKRLYAHARYGGRFVHKETGIPVSEKDYPKAVLQNGSHFHRETKTWIKYTHPQDPWEDRADMRTADDQHFSVYDALMEVYKRYPWDEALRWEVIFAAHRFLFQIPGYNKGTYAWDPGQERAQGRIPKFAAKCVEALLAAGKPELAGEVGIRSADRLSNQAREFRENILRGSTPIHYFEGWGKHSPAEVGIHWWGLDAAQKMFKKHGIKFLENELCYMKNYLARFCFDAFFEYDDELHLPYYVVTDWTHKRKSSGGAHFAWLAARHASPKDENEERKMRLLKILGLKVEDRFKGDLA